VAAASTYRAFATPLNSVGAIELEAIPDRNHLVGTGAEQNDPLFSARVGDLDRTGRTSADQFNRFAQWPAVFLGHPLRHDWNRDVTKLWMIPMSLLLKRVARSDL